MALVQRTVEKGGKNFQKALMFTGRSIGIGILIWLFVMILASTLQIIAVIDFITIDFVYLSRTTPDGRKVHAIKSLDVDVATFIIVGAIDLVLKVLHTLALVIGMIIVWLVNAFIFGEDSSGNVLNPLSLFQVLKLIPFIQDIVAGVHGIDESIIVSLDSFLIAIDNLFYSIANGFFTGIASIYHNIAEGILGKRRG